MANYSGYTRHVNAPVRSKTKVAIRRWYTNGFGPMKPGSGDVEIGAGFWGGTYGDAGHFGGDGNTGYGLDLPYSNREQYDPSGGPTRRSEIDYNYSPGADQLYTSEGPYQGGVHRTSLPVVMIEQNGATYDTQFGGNPLAEPSGYNPYLGPPDLLKYRFKP